jgi:hypothetical protein
MRLADRDHHDHVAYDRSNAGQHESGGGIYTASDGFERQRDHRTTTASDVVAGVSCLQQRRNLQFSGVQVPMNQLVSVVNWSPSTSTCQLKQLRGHP